MKLGIPDPRRMLVAAFAACVFLSAPLAGAGAEPWTERATLAADDGAINDYLGRSVAMDGDTVVVGAVGSDVDGNDSQGAAYVFVRDGETWTQQAKLVASDGVGGDEFGFAVAISGETIVVGARMAAIGANAGQGAAYVFVRSAGVWNEQGKLSADDGAAWDELGFSVAIDGDTVLVGSPFSDSSQGKVYVYTRSGTAWSGQATLTADDGAASDRFGIAVDVQGDTAIVGSPSHAVGASSMQGAAYVFVRAGAAWSGQGTLTASDGAAFDEFGNAVSLDGETAVVGAHAANIGPETNQGAAYAFVRSGTSWSEEGKLVSDSGSFGDEFGSSVAISGDTALVGAMFADPFSGNQGAAYLYTRSAGAWTQETRFVTADGASGDEFGIGAAIDGHTAVIGAEFGLVNEEWRGAAYVFSSRSATPLPHADVSPGTLSFALAPEATASDAFAIANVGDAGSTLDYSIAESEADCSAPADVPWLDVSPASGSLASDASEDVTVTVDASGLANGAYAARLCIATNDAEQPLIAVDVALDVGGVADLIFADGFETL